MKRLTVLLVVLPYLIAAQATLASAESREERSSQQTEMPEPTPLEDPYLPPAGDPDIGGDEGLGEGTSPLNPGED